MKCLVVDDSPTMRRILVNTLEDLGCAPVIEAEHGVDALERFDPSVDVVLTDWVMPVMGGLDLVRALRAAGRTLPILMVTTRSNRDDILQAVEAGVTGYLLKPFTPQSVREKLEEITGMGLEAGG
jgi:two-component system chemotaxis response regulator CheY